MVKPLSLPKIENLATTGGYNGIAALSNLSAAMLLSVCLWLHDFDNWTGVGYELTDAEKDDIDNLVSNAEYELMLATLGLIMPYVGGVIPAWLLVCDGATHQRVDYPDLYEILDPEFKISADTFVVPDLMDRVVLGAGGNYDVNEAGGEVTHTMTIAETASHSHRTAPHSHSYTAPVPIVSPEGGGVPIPSVASVLPAVTGFSNVNILNTGNGQPHNNMQPFLPLVWVIVVGT